MYHPVMLDVTNKPKTNNTINNDIDDQTNDNNNQQAMTKELGSSSASFSCMGLTAK